MACSACLDIVHMILAYSIDHIVKSFNNEIEREKYCCNSSTHHIEKYYNLHNKLATY